MGITRVQPVYKGWNPVQSEKEMRDIAESIILRVVPPINAYGCYLIRVSLHDCTRFMRFKHRCQLASLQAACGEASDKGKASVVLELSRRSAYSLGCG